MMDAAETIAGDLCGCIDALRLTLLAAPLLPPHAAHGKGPGCNANKHRQGQQRRRVQFRGNHGGQHEPDNAPCGSAFQAYSVPCRRNRRAATQQAAQIVREVTGIAAIQVEDGFAAGGCGISRYG
ncbi:MAG TPA: hypothetical protein VG796_17590 [Verrucomicrobiales bacterium]|nr:hypothetical protein [Verrucomicrobiales bacterium]